MQKYEITIFWDNNDKIYVAEAPDLPGCVAHGKTQFEALEKVNEAIELWLATAREFGDDIPKPSSHLRAA